MKGLGGLRPDEIRDLCRALAIDPLLYCKRVLNFNPTEQQEAVLNDIRTWVQFNLGKPFHEQKAKRIAIKSGHGTGKSRLLAALLHWWQTTRKDGISVCTAPKKDQLKDVLWREFSKLHGVAIAPFNDHFEILEDEIRHKEAPKTQVALARTARKENPEALQGFHDPNLMILVDEASGVPEEVYVVGEGALSTPGCLVVLAGNPTRVEGTFFNAFHKDRALWDTYTFDRSKLDPSKYSFLDPAYPDRMAAKYGRDSNVYRVRVLGEFPTADPDTLIPLWMVERSVGLDLQPVEDDPLVFGVDVARFGDDESVLVKRHGPRVVELKTWRNYDTMQVAYAVHMEAKKEKEKGRTPARIFVDSIGVGGGVADRLRDLGWDVMDVNVSERTAVTEDFFRLRDELFWKMREDFEGGTIAIDEDAARLRTEDDSELVNQLSTIKYEYRDSKMKVESKQERKRRGLHSPDRADALMLTYAQSFTGLRPEAVRQARSRLMPKVYVDS